MSTRLVISVQLLNQKKAFYETFLTSFRGIKIANYTPQEKCVYNYIKFLESASANVLPLDMLYFETVYITY